MTSDDLAVLGYFGEGNFGDDLLAERLLNFLCRHVQPERIVVSSTTTYLERWFPGIRCAPMGRLLRTRPKKVILGGGGLLFAFGPANGWNLWGLRRASAAWYWRRLGLWNWQRCRAFGFCLGIGPLHGALANWATTRFLAPLEHISVRDAASATLVSELGLSRPMVLTDPVCSYASQALPSRSRGERAAGIVIRDWEYSGEPSAMLPRLVQAAVTLRQHGWHVEFLSFHGGDDRPAIASIERLGERVRAWDPEQETIPSFRRHLASFSVLLSMRAHGVLLAAIDGLSPVAIAIEPKLRIFAERFVPGRPCLETSASPQSIVAAIEQALEQGPVHRDWTSDTQMLEDEYALLRQWIDA